MSLAGVLLWPLGAAAGTCATDCAQTACSVDCSEDDIRDAVKKANDCLGDPAWTGRTITIAAGTPPCTIVMLNDAAMAERHPNSSCPADREAHAVCLRNDGIRLVGAGATFVYGGDAMCGQCAEECPGVQPALFTLKGNGNTVGHFTFRYFPEGIHVRDGNGHEIARVVSDRICEDAITLDVTAGRGHRIHDSTLIGNRPADAGRTCVLASGAPGPCGTDKAIQLNGGEVTIDRCTIDAISQPVQASGGSHRVTRSRTVGSATEHNVCQSYTASNSATLTMQGNTIAHCKFGIRVDGTALVIAEDNVIASPWVSAFDVRASGRLKGQGNRIRTGRSGFTDLSSVQRGVLVARNDSSARIDFGGGDREGLSVVDGTPCAAGGDCSGGGNRFCSSGSGVQTDIWNITDCPCLNQLCNGTLGVCSVSSCAPLDGAGRCEGTAGSGASIGARDNCFQSSGGRLLDVRDGGNRTATEGAQECSARDCEF